MNKKSTYIINQKIIEENESAARKAYEQGDYVLCFLLIHALIESLLRAFLGRTGKERFNDLIKKYSNFMKSEGQTNITFVKELTQFNRRRNRVIHNLWKQGYSATNEKLASSCHVAYLMYGLFIEWLETFNPEITEFGFHYDD